MCYPNTLQLHERTFRCIIELTGLFGRNPKSSLNRISFRPLVGLSVTSLSLLDFLFTQQKETKSIVRSSSSHNLITTTCRTLHYTYPRNLQSSCTFILTLSRYLSLKEDTPSLLATQISSCTISSYHKPKLEAGQSS